jgi:hypothetical protein
VAYANKKIPWKNLSRGFKLAYWKIRLLPYQEDGIA